MPHLRDILGNPALNGVYRLRAGEEAALMDQVPVLDGRSLTGKSRLLEALGRALDLPDYYGVNWDALEECLGDFSWRSGPIRLFLHHADAIPTGLLDTLIAVFSEAAAEWSRQGRVCSLFLADTGRRELPEAG